MSYYQQIYNRLRWHGITQAGALGILGNFDCESNCEPFRLQGDFSPYRTASKAFVTACTNGAKTKADFANGRVGFGIAQWTSADRQAALWDFWKASGKALDDAGMQADFACKELESYSGLYSFLKSTTDVYTACSRVCREFERPAVNNIDARFAAAKRIQASIDLSGGGDEPEPDPTPEPTPTIDHSLVLRTVDYHCEGFAELDLLWAVLALRNYEQTWDAVKQFQSDNGLTADGVVGNLTWTKLLTRG